MISNSLMTESGRSKALNEDTKPQSLKNENSNLPTTFFLALAGGAIALSLGLAMRKKEKTWANLTGIWAPTFLLLGIYNKIIKIQEWQKKSESKSLLH